MIAPTLHVGVPLVTLCVTPVDAERPWLHSHAGAWERSAVLRQVCRRTHTLTNTVAAINQATAATASDASNRSRSTITYSVAKYTKYGMIDHIPNKMVVFKSATVRPLPTM